MKRNITFCLIFLLVSALLIGKIEIVKAEELETLSGSDMNELVSWYNKVVTQNRK